MLLTDTLPLSRLRGGVSHVAVSIHQPLPPSGMSHARMPASTSLSRLPHAPLSRTVEFIQTCLLTVIQIVIQSSFRAHLDLSRTESDSTASASCAVASPAPWAAVTTGTLAGTGGTGARPISICVCVWICWA